MFILEVFYIVVVNNVDNMLLWVIEVFDMIMNVKVIDVFVVLVDKDYEFWMVLVNGEVLIFFGLMFEVNGDMCVILDILLD